MNGERDVVRSLFYTLDRDTRPGTKMAGTDAFAQIISTTL